MQPGSKAIFTAIEEALAKDFNGDFRFGSVASLCRAPLTPGLPRWGRWLWWRLQVSLALERFRAKWVPVRVKKTRQNKNLEPGSDSIRTGNALALSSASA